MDTGNRLGAIAAHRGWHAEGARENGLDALERAHAGGADWVELDVRRLGDGTLIVHHDPRLDGTPLHVLDRTVLDRHPEVPTLDDWARRAGELDVGVLAEVKEPGIEQSSLDVLRRHVRSERLNLMSFEPAVVRRLADLAPDLPVGLLTYDLPATRAVRLLVAPESVARQAKRAGASFVAMHVGQATERVLAAAARQGLGVATWTVDDADDLSRLLADPRVATVITDEPARAMSIRSSIAGAADEAIDGVRLLRAAATMR